MNKKSKVWLVVGIWVNLWNIGLNCYVLWLIAKKFGL